VGLSKPSQMAVAPPGPSRKVHASRSDPVAPVNVRVPPAFSSEALMITTRGYFLLPSTGLFNCSGSGLVMMLTGLNRARRPNFIFSIPRS